MASRRKRTIFQADPDASAEYSISLNQAYRPAIPSASTAASATSSRSSTPAGAVETTSQDRRRVRREPFPVPNPSAQSSSVPDAPDAATDTLPDGNDMFANHNHSEAFEEEEGGQAASKAKRYLSSVSIFGCADLLLELTEARMSP